MHEESDIVAHSGNAQSVQELRQEENIQFVEIQPVCRIQIRPQRPGGRSERLTSCVGRNPVDRGFAASLFDEWSS